jgi:hypothetical protein
MHGAGIAFPQKTAMPQNVTDRGPDEWDDPFGDVTPVVCRPYMPQLVAPVDAIRKDEYANTAEYVDEIAEGNVPEYFSRCDISLLFPKTRAQTLGNGRDYPRAFLDLIIDL